MQVLNDKLFNLADDKLRLHEDVRNKLIDIANAFLDELRYNDVNVYPADIRLVGSNAGFDYTLHSDVDLHIVVNFDLFSEDSTLLQNTLNISRLKFNDQYNISVKGIEVEVYVEDIKSATISNGIYSIMQNRWIKFPENDSENMEAYITSDIEDKSRQWEVIIQKVLESDPATSTVPDKYAEDALKQCDHIISRLYLMRKTGLETGGRLSAGNLIFKQVRNSGMLDALKNKRAELLSFSLTLESLRRNK